MHRQTLRCWCQQSPSAWQVNNPILRCANSHWVHQRQLDSICLKVAMLTYVDCNPCLPMHAQPRLMLLWCSSWEGREHIAWSSHSSNMTAAVSYCWAEQQSMVKLKVMVTFMYWTVWLTEQDSPKGTSLYTLKQNARPVRVWSILVCSIAHGSYIY